jgi:hypothetical protein
VERRFAPSAEDEQAVVDWAESVGLTVTKRYSDRLIVNVEGTAGTIEKAFGVTINNYQVGDEVDFSNDRDPIIPANLSGILSFVTGLSNVERPHRMGSRNGTVKGADYVAGPEISEPGNAQGDGDPKKAPASRRSAMTSREAAKSESLSALSPKANDNYPLDYKSGTYAMDPANVQSSNGYDFNALQKLSQCCNEPGASAGSPPESSIALVGYGGFVVSDVNTFASAYGMAYNLTWYCIGGGSCPGNDGEAPLDVEYSMAMSNSYGSSLDTAHIYEYEMTNGLYTTYESAFNDIVSDGHAKVVSTSYGWEENVGFSGSVATGTMHPIFNTMVGTGITLIASSGDSGATAGCGDATAVSYPASDPDFIAAGGTQLNMYSDGVFYSETAWQGENWSGACGSNHGGSTGGVSVLFAAPAWQKITNSTYPQGVVSPFYLWKAGGEYVETGNGNRMVPDISLTANPDVLGQWYVSGGSWQDEGGTSIVAPELAGFFAQENSYLDSVGSICGGGSTACSPIGLASPFIYEAAVYGAPHNPFYDMTSGCSDNDVTAADDLYYYCAYDGYDPITGWGSANMMQLAWGINWWVIPAVGSPSLSFGGPTINTWYNTDQLVDWVLDDSGGSYPAPGAAGFTLGWDSIPSDSSSKPHGGDGDTFYTGPAYPLSTFGCVDNDGSYCEAASGQGCHTVYVRGWDNQGRVTNGSYGPVCFDSVAPTVGISTSVTTGYTTYVDKNVTVTLTPSDPGGSAASGIKATYYAINSLNCSPTTLGSCSSYSGAFTLSGSQLSYIYYFTVDNAGNASAENYIWVAIDEIAPTTTATPSGDLQSGIYYSKVSITLNAADTGGSGVANTYYTVDGGAQTTYGSAIVVSATGSHTLKYWSVDAAGNVEGKHTLSFTIAADTATTLTAPAASSTFAGPSVTFSWAAATGANGYFLHLGSTAAGSDNILNSTEYSAGTTSVTIKSLPLNGEKIYARLFTDYNGNHVYHDYTFTAAQQAVLTAPTAMSTLAGPSVTFSWSAATGSINGYFLHVGNTGVGSNNLLNSTEYGTGTTSVTLNNMPTAGGPIYVRVFTDYNGTHVYQDYQFTAAQQALLTSPAQGATLPGATATFDWSAATGSAVKGYYLHLGTTAVGSDNLLNSAEYPTTTTSVTVNNMPTTGVTIYVRVFTDYNGTHVYKDYTVNAAN